MAYAGTSADYLFRMYHIDGAQMQVYKAIMVLPWAFKPIFGVISDTFPIMGYKKAPYILIVTVLAIFGFAYVAFSPDSAPLPAIVCGLIAGSLQASVVDLLVEARYSEKMREFPEYGPDLVTFVWSGVSLGGLVATSTIGVLLQYGGGPKTVYMICAFAAAIMFIPTSLGYLEEQKMSIREARIQSVRMLRRQPEILFLAVLMASCVMAMAVSGIVVQNITVNFIVAVSLGFLVIFSFAILLRPIIASIKITAVVQTALSLSIDGGVFYFFTDSASQYPDGPHFSPFFYTTVMGLVAGVFGLVGIWSYNRYMKEWTYPTIYYIANSSVFVLHLLGLVIYTRTNVAWGISDEVFVLSSSVLNSVVGTWMWIPGVTVVAHLCPKGLEASMYALLAGCHNLGSSVSQYAGAFMLHEMGITPNGSDNESSKFDNLWIAVLISACLPLITMAIIPFTIPAKPQTEPILTEHPHSATVGSIWERIRAALGYKVEILSNPEEDLVDETSEPEQVRKTDDPEKEPLLR
jgi:MFS family permease